MARIPLILILFLFIGLPLAREAQAGREEPKPVKEKLFVSGYEQMILQAVMDKQEPDAFQLLLASAAGMSKEKEELLRADLLSFVGVMEKKKERASSEKVFLQKLFYKVHRRFLKEYQPYENFYTLLKEGSYNCLSGTALYAFLLDELKIPYQIIETDHHIFIMVETADKEQILIESTDPLDGFLSGQNEIDQRLKDIQQDVLPGVQAKNRNYHDFKLDIFRRISLKQLAGLQYYNQAAKLYNQQQFAGAELSVSKGRLLYQADRFDKLAQLLTSLE